MRLGLSRSRIAATLVAVALMAVGAPADSRLASPLGVMAGVVADAQGIPQMGARISLIGADGLVLQQVYSNDKGIFLMERVVPGLYSLRVSLASFLPIWKENLLIEPGIRSFLSINLASLFDTAAVLRGRRPAALSDDDWTWAVRSSGAIRPVLRWVEVERTEPPAGDSVDHNQAVIQFNGGAGRSSRAGNEADFNTSFTLANHTSQKTSFLVSGNIGYERSTPATAFRGVVRRELPTGQTPEVSVTLRQIFLPSAFFGMSGARDERMQSLTLAAADRFRVADDIRIEYGFLFDSIDFLQKLNSFSPYGRVIYQPGDSSTWRFYYTQGAPRDLLPGGDALREVASDIAVFPRIALRNGRPTIQRGRHIEVSHTRKLTDSTTVDVGAYRDELSDVSINASLGEEITPPDFLPDVFTHRQSFNAGGYQTGGLRAAVDQRLGEHLQATFAYSYGGVLVPERDVLYTSSPDELRRVLRMQRTQALAARLSADIPVTKTRVYAGYKWVMAPAAVTILDMYDESLAQAEPHLNILIRQPLPSMVVLPGRVEALADFRNLLAQGYVPIMTADGRRLLIVQNARSFRGGFSFVF